MRNEWAIALHGGAGVNPERDYARAAAHLRDLAEECGCRLAAGEAALDTVQWAVEQMEDSGLYVAGRGTAANRAGIHEFDAALMDGARHRAGAVAAVRDCANPVKAARAVLEHSPHVLLAGEGATAFARQAGVPDIPDPDSWFRLPVGVSVEDLRAEGAAHGTVGAVARDAQSRLAAATSTGGTFGKAPGRIGDTPLIGAGTWADRDIALSATGVGECFILAGGVRDVAARMRYGGATVDEAARACLSEVARLGGDGGLIGIGAVGPPFFHWNSPGMKRAGASASVSAWSAIV